MLTLRRSRTPRVRSTATGFDHPDFLALGAMMRGLSNHHGIGLVGAALLRPHRAARMAITLLRLPRVRLAVTDEPQGRCIKRFFHIHAIDRLLVLGASALAIPAEPEAYTRGRSRQALRTNCSRARREGTVVVGPVTGPEVPERMSQLFARRDDSGSWYFERAATGEGEFWFAVTGDGATAALTEIIVDREVALLRSMISAPVTGFSDARYLLMAEVIANLNRRQVRHLVVERSLTMTSGLMYFAKLLGFVPTNLAIRTRRK